MMSHGIVYIVDDDIGMFRLLREMIASIGSATEYFPDAPTFLKAYDRQRARSCLLCDIRLPVMSGLQLQAHLNESGAHIPIIFMTGFADVDVAVEAMKRGAFDFIQKPFSTQAHLDRVHDALNESEKRFSRSLHDSTIAARVACLTPQERRITDYVIAGQSSPAIARMLGLSQRTIQNHRANIMDKLHVSSTPELIRLLLDPGGRPPERPEK